MGIEDKSKQIALDLLRANAIKNTQVSISNLETRPDFIALLNADGTVTGPNGESLTVVNVGTPSKLDAAVKLNSTQAAMIEESFPMLSDEPSKSTYVIYTNATGQAFLQIGGSSTLYPIPVASIYPGPSGPQFWLDASPYPTVKFALKGKHIFIYKLDLSNNFYWGYLSNFYISSGAVAGTVVQGTTVINTSTLPVAPSPAPDSVGGLLTFVWTSDPSILINTGVIRSYAANLLPTDVGPFQIDVVGTWDSQANYSRNYQFHDPI